MESIYEHKEFSFTETPVLLFECTLPNHSVERWSTHGLTIDGNTYHPRVVLHNTFEVSTASEQGVDAIPRVSLVLANADGHFSQVERSVGWKGLQLTVTLLFVNLTTGQAATNAVVLFRGILNPPEQVTEKEFRLTAVNRMNLQRVLLPSVRIQKRCPWEFPRSLEERAEALTGGPEGQYSIFFKCGYSPDIEGGTGNLNGTNPFSGCNYTRQDCQQRGMFSEDSSLRSTKRFGGVEFVPASILVRTSGDRAWHQSPVVDNQARFNDFVPLVYGTAWCTPPVVFSRNDGNLTHFEVLLGLGEIEEVLKVVVNDIEIPLGMNGRNMTGTGWFNVISAGTRTGGFNLDFKDGAGNAQGDPYGSMAYLSVVVPNRIDDGQNLPRLSVLMKGLRLPHYSESGEFSGTRFSNNPAWILLDVLRRTGWRTDEVDFGSFARAAAFCEQTIEAEDLHGNPVQIPRFQCNLALRKRRTGADVVRSIRNSARLFLTYSMAGRLEVKVENTLALQQPVKPAGSNATSTLNGGWPAYEFGDGTTGFGGIVRRQGGESTLGVFARSTSDTPNRFAVEFQDEFNEFQQDSLSMVDLDDVRRIGQEIGGAVYAAGIANFNQAARILKLCLDRSVSGNTYVEFETSVRAIGLQPGDLITLTYLREGFQRQPFRVIKLEPSSGFRSAKVTAQIHKDEWFGDVNTGEASGRGSQRQPTAWLRVPKPLMGATIDADGNVDFALSERVSGESDGGSAVEILAGFTAPAEGRGFEAGVPLLSLAAVISSGGAIKGDQVLYYAVSAVGMAGEESDISFLVRAAIPPGTDDRTVTLKGLSFPPGTSTFRVYRGGSPAELYLLASDLPTATEYTDTGSACQIATPRDPGFHHANFYWRFEIQPEVSATIHGQHEIGNGALLMQLNEHRGRVARITRGRGRGQERGIVSNNETTLTLGRPWAETPDASSVFVIAESVWRFGGAASSSPGTLLAPNRSGATVHISGRSANANDVESPAELATVSRWTIGGGGAQGYDLGPPPTPEFSLSLPPSGKGIVELAGISFADLANTRGVTAGVLRLFYWNELAGAPGVSLAAAAQESGDVISVTTPHSISSGTYVQVDRELLHVVEVLSGGSELRVTRGALNSYPAIHAESRPVFALSEQTATISFPRDFFGSPASGNWRHPVVLPNARIAGAEVQVANGIGLSPVGSACVTQTIDAGLRTLSGGQIVFTAEGFLAIQDRSVPDFTIERDRSVGFVSAVVQQAPTGTAGPGIVLRLRQNTTDYCTMTIANGSTSSNTVNGLDLPVLKEGSRLSLDIVSVGAATPGSDLTLTIQL